MTLIADQSSVDVWPWWLVALAYLGLTVLLLGLAGAAGRPRPRGYASSSEAIPLPKVDPGPAPGAHDHFFVRNGHLYVCVAHEHCVERRDRFGRSL